MSAGAPAWTESDFDSKYERDYNVFNPLNEYCPDNPLNRINAYDPKNPFNPINRFDPGNPANPLNQFDPTIHSMPSTNTIPRTR